MLNRLISEIRFRLRALFRRNELEQELDTELSFHLEKEAEKLSAIGYPPEEASRRAHAAFGAVQGTKDDARDARGISLIDSLVQDLRYALRGLRRRPAFTLGVVLTLGLGIGANAAMFGIVDRLLFRPPLGLKDPETAHRVFIHRLTQDRRPRTDRNFGFRRYLDLQRSTRSFESFAAFQTRTLALGEGSETHEVKVTVASASYFSFFDVRPALGRFYGPAEDSVPAGSPVVVLGHGYWQSHFGGRQDLIGQPLRIDRATFTIIGVAPRGFVGAGDQGMPAAFIPITAYANAFRGPRYPESHTWTWLEMLARRKPDISEAAANQDLTNAFLASWRETIAANPTWGKLEDMGISGELGPMHRARGPHAGRDARVATWVLGVAAIVLLIACANVANLFLSRAFARRREFAMRLALGVTRGRLARQLLTESLVLALIGGAVGLVIAQWGAAALRAAFLDDAATAVIVDPRTLFFTALAVLITALLTGIVPALQTGRGSVNLTLKGGANEGPHRSRARPLLLVFQATLSVVLLIGAGLFVKSLSHVRNYRLGYDVAPILFASANPRGYQPSDPERRTIAEAMLETAKRLPGVQYATLTISVPFWSNEGRGLWVTGVDSVNRMGSFFLNTGSPDYFKTMGTRILRGRAFDERDRAGAAPVLVVGERMAEALWPGQDALSKCVRIGADTAPCSQVIGVAEEMRLRSLTAEREYSYYLPEAQHTSPPDPQVFVRVTGDPERLIEPLRRELQKLMPAPAYVNVVPLSQLVDPNLRAWKFGTTMFVAFGGLALLLAAIGLYSMIAYDVTQRTRELGVRIALGSSVAGVLRLIVSSGLRLVGAGVVLGVLVALWSAKWMEGLMFQQEPRDPLIYGVVAGILLLVAVVAAVVPALRATRIDPNSALRLD
jgi:putative ABC transport system permease protein